MLTNSAEKVFTKVRHAPVKFLAMELAVFANAHGAIYEPSFRNTTVPEPFNWFNHVANAVHSTLPGYVAGLAAGKIYTRSRGQENASKHRTRAIMGAAGFAVGVAANTLSETRLGMRIIDWNNVPDVVDFGYGVVAATAAAALVPNVTQEAIECSDPSPVSKPI